MGDNGGQPSGETNGGQIAQFMDFSIEVVLGGKRTAGPKVIEMHGRDGKVIRTVKMMGLGEE